MKHTAPDSMKFRRLQRRLRLPRYAVVGLLETLWIATAKNAPQGDIGRYSNEELAVELDWEGEPDELVDHLVETGWLDRSQEHRLVVHHWGDHCPNFVKGGLASQGLPILSPSSNHPTGRGGAQGRGAQGGGAQGQGGQGHGLKAPPQPNLTKPNLTKPNPTKAAPGPNGGVSFEKFVELYPTDEDGRKTGRIEAESIWTDLTVPDRIATIEAVTNYRRTVERNGRKVRGMDSFLANGWWRDWLGDGARPTEQPRPKPPAVLTGANARYELGKRGLVPRRICNEWTDEKCLHEFVARMAGVQTALTESEAGDDE